MVFSSTNYYFILVSGCDVGTIHPVQRLGLENAINPEHGSIIRLDYNHAPDIRNRNFLSAFGHSLIIFQQPPQPLTPLFQSLSDSTYRHVV